MSLVMTLLVRDERDIVRENIEFHLNCGVDFVIATDNGSTDGTREILVEYQEDGVVHLIDEPGRDYSQWKWVTRMAHMATQEYGATWILNNDADEFWFAPQGDLRAHLDGLDRSGQICRRVNLFGELVTQPGESWAEKPRYRVSRPVRSTGAIDIDDELPARFLYLDLPPKALLPAEGLVEVSQGNHSARYETAVPWKDSDIRIYHIPFRSAEQARKKIEQGGAAYAANTELDPRIGWHWRRWFAMVERGDPLEEVLREIAPFEPTEIDEALAQGAICEDVALARAMESLR